MMSSLPKMGWRYIHCLCSFVHSSRTSLTTLSVFSHLAMSSSNGFLNGEKSIACAMTMWSSSIWEITSSTRMTYVFVSRYSFTSSSTPAHSSYIFVSAVSIPYSFPATSQIFTMSSSIAPPSNTSMAMSFSSVNSASSQGMETPTPPSLGASASRSQCRGRIPAERSARVSGTNLANASSSFLIVSQFDAHVGSFFVVNCFCILCIDLDASETFCSISSASSDAKGVSTNHPTFHRFQFAAYVQNL